MLVPAPLLWGIVSALYILATCLLGWIPWCWGEADLTNTSSPSLSPLRPTNVLRPWPSAPTSLQPIVQAKARGVTFSSPPRRTDCYGSFSSDGDLAANTLHLLPRFSRPKRKKYCVARLNRWLHASPLPPKHAPSHDSAIRPFITISL